MNNFSAIIEGHFNELKSLFIEDENIIFSSRENICNNCPMKSGNNCDSNKYINTRTKEIATYQKEGYIKGCGCRLSAKQKAKKSRCPAGFWGREFKDE